MYTNRKTAQKLNSDIIIKVLFVILALLLMFLLIRKLKYDSFLSDSVDVGSESTLTDIKEQINNATTGAANSVLADSDTSSHDIYVSSPGALNLDAPMVALTFDDGPNNSTTGRILDVLEQYNCRATFFVVGSRLRANSTSVKRASLMGCEIGSHSYDHARLDHMKKSGIKKEFKKTNAILKKLTGKKASIVRTPYGATGKRVLNAVNYPVILWSIDSQDWKTRNKKKTVKCIMNNVKDGDIILMHDLYEETADAVSVIVPELLKQNYQLVTVSEMMEAKGIKLKPHKTYFNAY